MRTVPRPALAQLEPLPNMVFSTLKLSDEGLDLRSFSRAEARGKSRASKSADKQPSSITRSHSFPEPGLSEACRLPCIDLESINRDFENFRSGNHISRHSHSAPPPLPAVDDIISILTNKFYAVGDDGALSDNESKGKQKADDDIPASPPPPGQCELGCNPASTALIARILHKNSIQTRLDEKEPPAPATASSYLDEGRRIQTSIDYALSLSRPAASSSSSPSSPSASSSPPSPTIAADPDTHAASDISNHHSQSSVTTQLEATYSQLQLLLQLLYTQHRQCHIWVRLQSPHRQAERGLKRLVKAVDRLIQALKMTIASCFIINRILRLIWQLGNVFGTGKEEDIIDRANAVRAEVKDMRQELCERKSGS